MKPKEFYQIENKFIRRFFAILLSIMIFPFMILTGIIIGLIFIWIFFKSIWDGEDHSNLNYNEFFDIFGGF